MAERPRLLFLAHRIPYPPEKGEKIRAWHQFEHLARRFTVDLACLVDDRADLAHLPFLRSVSGEVTAPFVASRAEAAARALVGLRPGQPFSLSWFGHAGLRRHVEDGLRANRWDCAFVYSSAMAPYLMGEAARGLRHRVLDLVDVDSEKWAAYAADARPPMRWVYAREARTLLAFERRAVMEFDRGIFVSAEEMRHFAALAPETAPRLDHMDNGVDLGRFDPAEPRPSPFGAAPAIVFTGTMNYRPNVDAVTWFADAVLPRLATRASPPEFWIVGANPAPAVQALAARPGVRVTGTVPDVRPYIAHAAVCVAPLRIARGIQNKVLEAMAMARPMVATPQAFEGVRARPGDDLLVADGAERMVAAIGAVLDGAHPGLGARGRAAVLAGHDWAGTLRRLDALLPS
jgi:sugar transferase (PEP-CTERM/EpsH1 system associated)